MEQGVNNLRSTPPSLHPVGTYRPVAKPSLVAPTITIDHDLIYMIGFHMN